MSAAECIPERQPETGQGFTTRELYELLEYVCVLPVKAFPLKELPPVKGGAVLEAKARQKLPPI
jgi:hypothetical protein